MLHGCSSHLRRAGSGRHFSPRSATSSDLILSSISFLVTLAPEHPPAALTAHAQAAELVTAPSRRQSRPQAGNLLRELSVPTLACVIARQLASQRVVRLRTIPSRSVWIKFRPDEQRTTAALALPAANSLVDQLRCNLPHQFVVGTRSGVSTSNQPAINQLSVVSFVGCRGGGRGAVGATELRPSSYLTPVRRTRAQPSNLVRAHGTAQTPPQDKSTHHDSSLPTSTSHSPLPFCPFLGAISVS